MAQQGHWNKEDEESSKKKGMRGNDREKWLAGKLLQVKESKRIMLWKLLRKITDVVKQEEEDKGKGKEKVGEGK